MSPERRDREVSFETAGPVSVPSGKLLPLELVPTGEPSPHVAMGDDRVVFSTPGWYEVLLLVHWDEGVTDGTRFSHTKIPGQQPLHSEAIDAAVLAQISEGRQMLRGNTIFGPDRTSSLILEVWQDSGREVEVRKAGFTVRELEVPWRKGA